jgi:tetratricopeptide (TPR) repeat protein
MVSTQLFVLLSLAAATAAGQQQPVTNIARTEGARQTSVVPPPTADAKPAIITPEMRGDILMARKMYREAVDTYSAIQPQTAILLNKIGIAYHQMLEMDIAKKYYERAIKLNPKYSEAINNLGTVHYGKKSYRRAIGQYKKALKLNPNSASIYSNLGTAHFARKKYKDAAQAYEQALVLDPEVFERRSSHGVLLQERNVQERAKFFYYMARLYAKSGAVDRALIYIRKALEEGFKEKTKFQEEPEFALLQENAEFQQLMAVQPRVL